MFVLALREGYALIEQDEFGNTMLIDHVGGVPIKLDIKKKSKTVSAIPIGQIVMDVFNKKWIDYKNAGGTRNTALPKKHISLAKPYCPVWIYPKKAADSLFIDDINEHLMEDTIQVKYLPIGNEILPVFKVDKIEKLYFYDLLHMKQQGILIKQCAECGKAFRAATTGKYCPDCRNAGILEKRKRITYMSDPAKKIFHQIKDRNNNGKREDVIYKYYYANLCRIISSHTESDTAEQLLEFAKQLNALDKRYYALCKFFGNNPYEYYGSEELYKKWQAEKSNFPCEISEPQKWIEQWEQCIKP